MKRVMVILISFFTNIITKMGYGSKVAGIVLGAFSGKYLLEDIMDGGEIGWWPIVGTCLAAILYTSGSDEDRVNQYNLEALKIRSTRELGTLVIAKLDKIYNVLDEFKDNFKDR